MPYKDINEQKRHARIYYLKNREKLITSNRARRIRDPFLFDTKNTISKFKGRYGIKIELSKYLELYKQCDGKCEICGKTDTRNGRVSLDHCHSKNKLRGFLCGKCNMALGVFKDDTLLLNNAIKYLKKYE